jgi:hypothetical protein
VTVKQFREHKYLPFEWRKELRTNAILQRVLSVMEENHPARFVIQGDKEDDVSPTRAAIELGLTRGYSKFGDMLRLLGDPLLTGTPGQVGESTYEPEKVTQGEPPYGR